MTKKRILLSFFLITFLVIALTPIPNLDLAYSKVVYDKNGQLLSARIADDEQWRFPILDDLPVPLEKAIVYFEDEYFYRHPGVNPVSIIKAIYLNFKAKKIVRGGSTITMQVMRMYYGNRKRTFPQKIIEMLGALKLSILYSKKEVLKMWASVAPFGGNTVGAATASWRYFNRNLNQLSWAEYATLAVLPNTPSQVHMQKNVAALKKKRDFLLRKLHDNRLLDDTELQLALDEEIQFEQKMIPQQSMHFMEFLSKKYPKKNIYHSTIDPIYQKLLSDILNEYSAIYQFDGIENAAATIIDIEQNEVVAYVGNTQHKGAAMRFVDCVQAPRSYGSLLKPLLYTYAIDQGYFLPNEIIKDIPTNIKGFIPKNFDRKFRGIVPMNQMVSQSLNVPAVRILNYVGMESFHHLLTQDLGFSHINKDPNYHGLSLILGGAECSMWEISRAYKGLIRNQLQLENAFNEVKCLKNEVDKKHNFSFHPQSCWYALKAMMSLNRPKEEQNFGKMGGQKIAWKTGTSYGHRDAWSVGANNKYVVAVWVGNEIGGGVYHLTGVKKAAPILFRMMRHLDEGGELEEQNVWAKKVKVCSQSGMLKGNLCTQTYDLFVPKNAHQLRNCNHHQIIYTKNNHSILTKDTLYYLNPVEDYYHTQYFGQSMSLPASAKSNNEFNTSLRIVYPERNAVILVPKKLNQKYSKVKFRASSTMKENTLFWFLDGDFLKKTNPPHQLHVELKEGNHTILINDSFGNKDELPFSVVKRNAEE
ncbi:MAG TPA: penicillin-binding protein 1C [Phaeodactylibacter sp.]|nr:penicillin-binding protein 1C [Phaeodactylibacter sp.]